MPLLDDRTVGRLFAATHALALLIAVAIIEPGPARIVCSIGVGVLATLAAMPAGRGDVTRGDLLEVELALLDLRADVDERTDVGMDRLEQITGMVRAITDQLR